MEALPGVTNHHLIVTTAVGVYSWSNRGSTELFSSNSKGIVASRNMKTDKDLLAVADSQIVILHDIERGMQRTYRLRNEDQVYTACGFGGKAYIILTCQRDIFESCSTIQTNNACSSQRLCKMRCRASLYRTLSSSTLLPIILHLQQSLQYLQLVIC